jgi:hypothetical protein
MKFAINMNVTTIVMGAAILDLIGREWPDSLPAETTNLAAYVTHFDDFVIYLLIKFVWAMLWWLKSF